MTNDPLHQSKHELMLREASLTLGLLALWSLTAIFGSIVGKIIVVVESFIFLTICLMNLRGDRYSYHTTTSSTNHNLPCSLMIGSMLFVPIILTCGSMMFAMSLLVQGNLLEGLDTLLCLVLKGLSIMLIILVLISTLFFDLSKRFNEKQSILAVILGLLFGIDIVALLFFILTQ